MSPVSPLTPDTLAGNAIAAEAASWLAQLDQGELSNADRLALAEWVNRSPRHAEELRLLAQLWSDVDGCLDDLLLTAEKPSLWRVLRHGFVIRPLQLASAAAAGVALLALGSALWLGQVSLDPAAVPPAVHQTLRGESRSLTLSDGSRVLLNTDSVAEIRETATARIVRLIRGEAIFEVEPDPQRPFQVVAGDGLVEAVGTRFVVRVLENKINLLVTSGRVKLAAFDALPLAPRGDGPISLDNRPTELVDAGHRARLDRRQATVEPVAQKIMDRQTAWRDGRLIFEGEPLEYVVSEIGRYTETRIVISDADLRETPMGGVFQTGEVEALLTALESSMNIEVDRIRDDLVYLKRKPDPTP
ncbi:MAG: FecR domain-containing protein [Pseudomonadota bacterium]